jgi:hypothetical protein
MRRVVWGTVVVVRFFSMTTAAVREAVLLRGADVSSA